MNVFLYGSLIVIGMLLFYLAFVKYQQIQSLLSEGVRTKATVVTLIEKGNGYSPVFVYYDEHKNRIEYTSRMASSPPQFKVDQTVNIVYNATNPEDFNILTYWGLYRWVIIPLCISICFMVIGLGYFYYLLGQQS